MSLLKNHIADLLALACDYPGRFVAELAIDPTDPNGAVKGIDRCVGLGAKTVGVNPGIAQ